ncbi:MAG: anti-sigma factor family protein [Armatimonadota bacterium]
MRCTQVTKLLSAYQDGALAERHRIAMVDHLAYCPECAARAAELQQVCDLLGTDEAADTSPGFVATVMRRVQAERPRPAWQAPRWAVAAAVVVCLTCGGLAGYVQANDPQATHGTQVALATDVSQQLGLEAFAAAPSDTVAGAYVQFTGTERRR